MRCILFAGVLTMKNRPDSSGMALFRLSGSSSFCGLSGCILTLIDDP